jgi:hypothetical protein
MGDEVVDALPSIKSAKSLRGNRYITVRDWVLPSKGRARWPQRQASPGCMRTLYRNIRCLCNWLDPADTEVVNKNELPTVPRSASPSMEYGVWSMESNHRQRTHGRAEAKMKRSSHSDVFHLILISLLSLDAIVSSAFKNESDLRRSWASPVAEQRKCFKVLL